jgi:hypothetical protein
LEGVGGNSAGVVGRQRERERKMSEGGVVVKCERLWDVKEKESGA